jgi:ABC-2 type transport system ATP-binding protein
MMPILARGIQKSFGATHVLRGLDLQVAIGSVYGLLGRNGAGKTTLIRVLMGLARPDAGSSSVLGRNLLADGSREKPSVGYVAQDGLLPLGMSIGELVDFDHALRPNWDPASLQRWLGKMQIDSRRKVRELSGGERKRLALELALAARPAVLLLDEPFIAIDPISRAELMGELMGFAAEHGATILISSHTMSDLERLCDRIGVVSRGVIAHESTLEELKSGAGGSLEEIAVDLMRGLEEDEVAT